MEAILWKNMWKIWIMSQTANCNTVNVERCEEPVDFINLIFPYCKTISQRWSEKMKELMNEDLSVPLKL